MAKRILVPLDGSPASQAVLPLVADVARGSGGTVRLLRVEPVPENIVGDDGRVVAYADQEMARLETEGLIDLEEPAACLPDVPVERAVRFGATATEIALEADAWDADLVVMTAPRGGWLRWMRPRSTAERVLGKTAVPVLRLT